MSEKWKFGQGGRYRIRVDQEIVMIGSIMNREAGPYSEHFLHKVRKLEIPKTDAREMALRRLEAGFQLSGEEYAAAMEELGNEVRREHREVVAGLRGENSELREQVEGLKVALGKVRETVVEQDRVIRLIVRPNERDELMYGKG